MGIPPKSVCRICLEKCVDFKAVEDYMKEVLDVLLLKIDLAVSLEPVMCGNCAAMLMKCFEFKATCFYAHDFLVPFLDDGKISKVDLRTVYTSKHKDVDIPDEHSVCGFCMGLAKKCTVVSFDNKAGDVTLKKLIEKCLPELNFNTIDEPMICAPCYESLKTCFQFVTSCLTVEEKIMEYRELTGADVIEIADVLHWISRNVSNVKDGNSIGIIKTEEVVCVDMENAAEQVGQENGNFGHMEDRKLLLNEEIEIKTDQYDFDGFQEVIIENKSRPGVKMFQCEFCSYQTKWKSFLTRHLLTHKNPLEVKMFKCELCSYEAKFKGNLKTHLFIHKNPSEIKMFKCEMCPHEANHKGNLKKHFLTHKSPSEIKMFKCELCTYEARQRCQLETHLLTHKSPSEIKMFKCEVCQYETKYKSSLKNHLLIHKSPSEIKMFKCEVCSYETKYKSALKLHLSTHKNPWEIKLLKCVSCSYETKWKCHLNRHLLTHKNRSEIKMFKCE